MAKKGTSPEQPKRAEGRRYESIERIPEVDAIVVPGSNIIEKDGKQFPDIDSKMRLKAALRLMAHGHAHKIVLTGVSRDFDGESNIATAMRDYLIGEASRWGIDDMEDRIIIESQSSVNTSENVLYALKAIAEYNADENNLDKIESLLFVTHDFHRPKTKQAIRGMAEGIQERLNEVKGKLSEEEVEAIEALLEYLKTMEVISPPAETILEGQDSRYRRITKYYQGHRMPLIPVLWHLGKLRRERKQTGQDTSTIATTTDVLRTKGLREAIRTLIMIFDRTDSEGRKRAHQARDRKQVEEKEE